MAAKMTVNENGPLKIEGDFKIYDAAGNAWNLEGKPAVFICRCGQTSKAPFCDGTHKSCGFVGPSKAV